MGSVVEFHKVSIKFRNKPVLLDLSFAVDEEEKTVLTGPSGVGKTTVIRLITGFQEQYEGRITVFDETVDKQSIRAIRKKIFWLPQHFNPGNGSVSEFLDSIFAFKQNKEIKPSRDKMVDVLTKLLLPDDILEINMEQLSGGQLQRVGLGIGLMIKRPLVLLDEPTSQLDKKAKEKVARQYLARKEMTVISASHDPDWIGYMDKSIDL